MSGRPLRPSPPGRRQADHNARSRSTPLLAVIALVACVAAFIALVVGARLMIKPQTSDQASFCPSSRPLGGDGGAHIDTTDPLNPIQRAAVQVRLDHIVSGLRRDEEIVVYVLNPRGDPLQPAFLMCRPAKAAEVSELTGNRALAQARFDESFIPRIRAALRSSTAAGEATRSPIMAAIQAIAVSAFEPADEKAPGEAVPKRLIIVSDMLENSEAGDHYRGVPDFAAYKATPAYGRMRSRLDGVGVQILYLRRDDAAGVQGVAHVDFWNRWFADQGATVDDVVAIEE